MSRRYYSSTAVTSSLVSPIVAGSTSMIVSTVAGLPATFPYTILIDEDTAFEEAVEVVGRSGTTLSVIRGVDGTSAIDHDAGAVCRHGFSARDFDEPNAHVNATGDVHGVTGDLVGETMTQTLTNKSMSGLENTFSNIPQGSVSGLTVSLGLKANIVSPTFTGTVTLPGDTSIGDVDATELSYLDGATSNIQTQLDGIGTSTVNIDNALQQEIIDRTNGDNDLLLRSLPSGGATGHVLSKQSSTDYDAVWVPATGGGGGGGGVPDGGTTGQVLTKLSDTNGDADWADPTGGGGSSGPSAGESVLFGYLYV